MARKSYFSAGKFIRSAARFIALLLLFLFAAITALTLIARFFAVHPVSTLMLSDHLTNTPYQRDWTPLQAMAPNLIRAVIMAEDARFCSHSGVDWQALGQAATDEDGRRRGASTITMQLVKNLYFWNGRSYLRKMLELPAALWVDTLLPKKRNLEIYLNIAQWGQHIYGAEAASRAYFGISARDLTPRQAALLAVSLPSPVKRNPRRLNSLMLKRAAIIERRMLAAAPYTECLR